MNFQNLKAKLKSALTAGIVIGVLWITFAFGANWHKLLYTGYSEYSLVYFITLIPASFVVIPFWLLVFEWYFEPQYKRECSIKEQKP